MENALDFVKQIADGWERIGTISRLSYQTEPRELIFQEDKIKLYRYQAQAKQVYQTPLLMVFATVNRPEILDIAPHYSFIKELLKKGIDVYLLDWGYPDDADRQLTMDDYISHYLHLAIREVVKRGEVASINLMGICQGGILSLCYAAIYPAIKNLILITTPIDFHTRDDVVSKIARQIAIEPLSQNNLPGAWLTQFFISLKPFQTVGKKYLALIDHLKDPEWIEKFLLVEKWLHDSPDQAGAAFSEFIQNFYRHNQLIKDKITINRKKVKLSSLAIPVLNITARYDDIVPVSSSIPLKDYVGTADYTHKQFPSGHIGIYLSDSVRVKMADYISKWLKKRDK